VGLKPGFVVYDEDDQTALLKEIFKELGLAAKPGPIKSLLDRAKNQGVPPEHLLLELPEFYAGLSRGRLQDVLHRYQEALRAQGALDFGDILLYALKLLEEDGEVLKRVRKRARFIHVDEYQDTNPVQYRFTRLLAGEEANLMAVGDPDQGIYSFRAADIRNILDFTQDYPKARVYRLEDNYRSTEAILRFANAIIVKNALRLEKTLRPVKKGGEPVRLFRAESARDEARFVAEEIARLGPPFDRVAVLYRTNAQSRLLEQALASRGIPARVVGGVGFFERAEVKDLLAYARLSLNPLDAVSLKRVLNTPPRGIGPATVEKVQAIAKERGLPLFEALKVAALTLPRPEPLRAFLALMEELMDLAFGPAEAFFRHLLLATDYPAYLKEAYPEDAEDRLENVEELLRAAKEAESLMDFLDKVALTARAEEPAEAEGRVCPHDPPQRQGAGVSRGLPGGGGGGASAPPLLPLHPGGPRGGAPPLLRGGHPGPGAALPLLRPGAGDLRPPRARAPKPLPRGGGRGALRGLRPLPPKLQEAHPAAPPGPARGL
jgi:DNA helicase-2/ATP-dependent DNA helicase PcrA